MSVLQSKENRSLLRGIRYYRGHTLQNRQRRNCTWSILPILLPSHLTLSIIFSPIQRRFPQPTQQCLHFKELANNGQEKELAAALGDEIRHVGLLIHGIGLEDTIEHSTAPQRLASAVRVSSVEQVHGFVCPECWESFEGTLPLMLHYDKAHGPSSPERKRRNARRATPVKVGSSAEDDSGSSACVPGDAWEQLSHRDTFVGHDLLLDSSGEGEGGTGEDRAGSAEVGHGKSSIAAESKYGDERSEAGDGSDGIDNIAKRQRLDDLMRYYGAYKRLLRAALDALETVVRQRASRSDGMSRSL